MKRLCALPLVVFVLVLVGDSSPAQQKPAADAKSPPWELAKAKADAARKAFESFEREYREGKATQEQVRDWSNRWTRAAQDTTTKKSERLAAAEAHVERMKLLEKYALERFQAQRGQASEIASSEYFRLDAELQLSKERSSK